MGETEETDRKWLQSKITGEYFPSLQHVDLAERVFTRIVSERERWEICFSWSAILPYIIDFYQDWSSSLIVEATKQHLRDDDDVGLWMTCTAVSVLQRNCNQNKQPVGPTPVTRLLTSWNWHNSCYKVIPCQWINVIRWFGRSYMKSLRCRSCQLIYFPPLQNTVALYQRQPK